MRLGELGAIVELRVVRRVSNIAALVPDRKKAGVALRIEEVRVQSVGASAEFGNVQGAVIDVITRQGSDVFHHASTYFGRSAGA